MTKRFGALELACIGFLAFTSVGSASCGSSETSAEPSTAEDPAEVRPGGGTDGDGAPGTSGGDQGGPDANEPGPAPAPAPEPASCPPYSEALPTKASLDGVPFSRERAKEFLLEALARRYPTGKAIVEGGMSSEGAFGSCLDVFLTNKSSANGVLRNAATTVHECGHFYDLRLSKGTTSTYVIRPDLTFACESGDTTSRGGKTFARSKIQQDAHSAKRRPCGGGAKGCDSYASTYLAGQSGEQGYNFVLEEAAQYVNSLATALAFKEQYAGTNASERDGILTFLWYIERYLAMARADNPEAYELISEDACWRKLTLTIWDRGWFYEKATEGMDTLGIDDAELATLVNEPALTAEIDALRKLECE